MKFSLGGLLPRTHTHHSSSPPAATATENVGTPSQTNLNALPDEMLGNVLKFLPPSNQAALRRVNHRFQEVLDGLPSHRIVRGGTELRNALNHHTTEGGIQRQGVPKLEGIKLQHAPNNDPYTEEDLLRLLSIKSLQKLALHLHTGERSLSEAELTMIGSHPGLTQLDLSKCLLNVGNMPFLSTALRENRTLTSINLSENRIGSNEMMCLANALKDHPQLSSLNLSRNPIGYTSIEGLATLLKNTPKLKSLDAERIDFGGDQTSFVTQLASNQTLTSLCLGNRDLSDTALAALLEALQQHPTLSTLSLRNTSMGQKTTDALANLLRNNPQLKSLDLTGTRCNNPGSLAVLSAGLKANKTITSIALLPTELSSDMEQTAVTVLTALQKHPALTSLDISKGGCNISKSEMDALAKLVKQNKSLKSLNLRGNFNISLTSLIKALKNNPPLTSLDLSDIGIHKPEFPALAKALMQNKSLTSLNLRGNAIQSIAPLIEALKGNTTLTKLDVRDQGRGFPPATELATLGQQNPGLAIITDREADWAVRVRRP